jgi:hypothetical protein
MNHVLGIYENTAELDHDVEALLENLIAELSSRGVMRVAALAAIRRTVKK